MPETLLQTKLLIPPLRPNLVPRPSLIERLNHGLQTDVKLTLVSAPAGFGKTTLIVEWSRQLAELGAGRFAWFSLDENDNDLGRFFIYFITALQRIDGYLGEAALELLQSPQASDIQVVLTDLLNTLSQSSHAIVLILDDYHLITNPAIHQGIIYLFENAPPHFHLLLISRADPPFSLARLRARQQMIEIRQSDLRFEGLETIEFLNQLMALDLPDTAVAALEKRTEGWVAGLQMAALSLQGQADVEAFIRGFTGSNRFIFDYLAEEVLARRPAGTRQFLLQTAVLDRLCAPLCDAVLGNAEASDSPSQQILEQLESANLFLVPLDDERRWYRYHHLFADLLRQQLRREKPSLESAAHERASHWFEQANYAEEAIQHALAAADYERATDLVTHYSISWLNRSEIGKILMWTERLPNVWWQQNPQFILSYAWALLFRGRENEAETTIALLPPAFADTSIELLILRGNLAGGKGHITQAITLLEKADAHLKTLEPTLPNQTMRGLAVLNLAFIYQIQGDSKRAQENFQTAIALNREVGNWFGVMNAMRGLTRVLIEQAQLHEAETICHNGLQTERQWARTLGNADRKLVAAAPLHISLGQLYYQWNRLVEAEAQLVDAAKLVTLSISFDQFYGLIELAKLRLAQGQAEVIPPILAQLEQIGQRTNFPLVRRTLVVSLATIRCALYQQQPSPDLRAAIEQSLSHLVRVDADPLIQARVLITLDRPQEAMPLLEKRAAETEADELHGLWLSTAVLLSLAYHLLGEKNLALVWLQKAVQMAEAPGYIRLFIDEGEPLRQLLAELAQQKNVPHYTATLLTHFPADTPPIMPPPANDPLSPREREVLQLIAAGLTNQEIANKLVIAPSTAKRHVINIYNKLDINNRAEATARAYEMGLVNLE